MIPLYLKEVRSFLSSVVGYTFIIIFLVACWLFNWMIESDDMNLIGQNQADLVPFFKTAPYIFLMLIPAITMRSIAEERRSGTIELLFTRPISDLNILLAKYFAGVTLLLIALLPTLVYYFSIDYLALKDPGMDSGVAIASYIGLLLLGSAYVAIGIFASSLTSNQIVAYILACSMCYFFFDGLFSLGSYAQFGKLDLVIKYLSLSYHYEAINKGVLIAGDLIYCISVIVLFLSASLLVIKSLKK